MKYGMNRRRMMRERDPRVRRWNLMVREVASDGYHTTHVRFPDVGSIALTVLAQELSRTL